MQVGGHFSFLLLWRLISCINASNEKLKDLYIQFKDNVDSSKELETFENSHNFTSCKHSAELTVRSRYHGTRNGVLLDSCT